jgi:ribosomal protein S18 acetylase RimI-like enzyme
LIQFAFPPGFSIRCVKGIQEIEELVALHRDAFGTENMTPAQRLAIMDAPHYQPMLDLVAVAPNNELAAFCICGFVDGDRSKGYTDPIGTHPKYQRIGLGKALLSTGLAKLKNFGAKTAELGTSSKNLAMQNLASELGFVCIAEKLWFSKNI